MNISQAVAFANAGNPNLTDGLEIKAAKDHCACRGKCGNHSGPCMAACSKDSKTCKACADISAGGPGSGRKPQWQKDSPNHAKLDDLHKSLSNAGFKYKNSSSNTKGMIEHSYANKGDKSSAIIKERKNGEHSQSRKYSGNDLKKGDDFLID